MEPPLPADDEITRIQTPDELAEIIEPFWVRSELTYEEIARRLDGLRDLEATPRTSTVHGWLTLASIPSQKYIADFETCLRLIGVTNTQRIVDLLPQFRRQRMRRSPASPWVGLRPYERGEHNLFFGRSELIAAARAQISQLAADDPRPPITVLGASGIGKSSLLKAGLTGYLGGQGGSCAYLATSPGCVDEVLSIVARLKRERQRVRRVDAHDYLVLDQFEQVLDETTKDDANALAEALSQSTADGHMTVILGLRSDFYRQAADHSYVRAGLGPRSIHVGPMTVEQAAQCILGPAEFAGYSLAPNLVSRLLYDFQHLSDLDSPATALPMLSHVLAETTRIASSRSLTLEDYEKTGGLSGSLKQSADQAYVNLSTDAQMRCQEVFGNLVQLTLEGTAIGRTFDRQGLDAAVAGDSQVVVEEFAQARLLTVDEDTVQLSHESLVAAWPLLHEWIEKQRGDLAAVRRVQTATAVWLDHDEDPDARLAGSQLEPVVALLKKPSMVNRLGEHERRFIEQSQAAQHARDQRQRRVTRSLRGLTGALAVAAVLAGLLAWQTLRESDRADLARDEALSRQLALQASVLRQTDTPLSHQIALVGHETSPTVEARSAVIDATSFAPSPRFLGDPGSTALAISDDGRTIAYSNAVAGTVTVLIGSGSSMDRVSTLGLPDQESTVYSLDLSPDGRFLAAGGSDERVTIWDLELGTTPSVLPDTLANFTGSVQSLTFDSSASMLLAVGEGHGVGIWHLDQTGNAVESDPLPDDGQLMAISLSNAGDLAATANRNGTVAVWSLDNRDAPLATIDPVEETIASTVALSPDGRTLVAGYRNATIRIWQLANPTNPVEVDTGFDAFASWATYVVFSPSGSKLATASSDGRVRLWDTSNWQSLGDALEHPTVVTSAKFRSEDQLITSVADGSIRSWDLSHLSLESLDASIWSTTYDNAGVRLLAASGRRAAWWSVDATGLLHTRQDIDLPDLGAGLTGASAISPNGELTALGSRSGPVYLIPISDPEAQPQTLTGLTNLVENVAFSPDGRLLAGTDDDGRVQLWTVGANNQAKLAGQAMIAGLAMNVAFSPDSTILAASTSEGLLHLYNVSDPDDPIELAQAVTGQSIAFTTTFHPTEPVLATGNGDNSIVLWDYADPTDLVELVPIAGPNSRVFSIAFNNAGSLLAAGVGDNTVWIWDTATTAAPEAHAVLTASEQEVFSIAFSPDDRHLVGGGADQHLIAWTLNVSEAAERICASVGDDITAEEWSNLIPALKLKPPCD